MSRRRTRHAHCLRLHKNQDQGRNGEPVEYQIPFIKGYTVFNAHQIEGLPNKYYDPLPARLDPDERIKRAEEFFASTGADIRYGGNKAYYALKGDYIRMPDHHLFKDPESELSTLTKSRTGRRHPSRLAQVISGGRNSATKAMREKKSSPKSAARSFAANSILSPEPREENAAYIDHWEKTGIKGDKNFILEGRRHAQRAADFIISAHQAPMLEQNNEHDHDHDAEAPRPAAGRDAASAHAGFLI